MISHTPDKICKKFIASALIAAAALLLSGCSLPSLDFNKTEKTDSAKAAPVPPVDNPYTDIEPFEPFPKSPLGAFGVKVDDYFDNEPQTVDARLTRLEHAVTGLQQDLARLAPVIQRLSVITPTVNTGPLMSGTTKADDGMTDMAADAPPQSLQSGMQAEKDTMPSQNKQPMAQQTAAPEQKTARAEPKTFSKPKPLTRTRTIDRSGPATVKRLRLGEHDTKTRMVMDLTKKADYSYDIDTMEDLLIIELPGVKWEARRDWQAKDHPLISSYTASDIDGGTRLIVGLKNDASVAKELTIAPNSSPYYRIVIDLAR